MARIIALLLLLTWLLGGCYYLNMTELEFDRDSQFAELVDSLDTPRKVGDYLADNIEFERHFLRQTPYETYIIKKADCNDYAEFVAYVCNYHGYKVYLVEINERGSLWKHEFTIVKEVSDYNYIENGRYYKSEAIRCEGIIARYPAALSKCIIRDYDGNIIWEAVWHESE